MLGNSFLNILKVMPFENIVCLVCLVGFLFGFVLGFVGFLLVGFVMFVIVLSWIILGERNCTNTVGSPCLIAEACMQQGSTSVHSHGRQKNEEWYFSKPPKVM